MPVKLKATNQGGQGGGGGKTRPTLRGKEPDPAFGKTIRTSKQAPGFMFFMGGLGIFAWFIAGVAQVITTIVAFVRDTISNDIYKHMSSAEQAQALPLIIIACIAMAILIQIFVNIAAVRLDLSWKKGSNQAGGDGQLPLNRFAKMKAAAVEVSHQPALILIFGGVFFVANGIGDYGFCYSFTDSWIFLFFWGTILAVCGTILLPESAEYIWSGLMARGEANAHNQGNAAAQTA